MLRSEQHCHSQQLSFRRESVGFWLFACPVPATPDIRTTWEKELQIIKLDLVRVRLASLPGPALLQLCHCPSLLALFGAGLLDWSRSDHPRRCPGISSASNVSLKCVKGRSLQSLIKLSAGPHASVGTWASWCMTFNDIWMIFTIFQRSNQRSMILPCLNENFQLFSIKVTEVGPAHCGRQNKYKLNKHNKSIQINPLCPVPAGSEV